MGFIKTVEMKIVRTKYKVSICPKESIENIRADLARVPNGATLDNDDSDLTLEFVHENKLENENKKEQE